MCVRGVLAIVLSVLLVKCKAQYDDRLQYTSEQSLENETPLKCYDCNSDYDPRCGDPFNSYTVGTVICRDLKPPEHLVNLAENPYPNSRLKPTVCRKIVQKVENRTIRVVRECGYIQDDHDDKACFKRSGTKDIQITYCSCTNSLCNAAINIRPSLFSVGLILFPIVYLIGFSY